MKVSAQSNSIAKPQACKYRELSDILRQKISTLPGGTRIPSVRSLMKRHKLSLQTVSSALHCLADEKLIVSRPGSGFYVSDERERRLIILHRSHCHSPYEDTKETALRQALTEEGWLVKVLRHDISGPDLLLPEVPEPNASAHIVAQDLAALHSPLLQQLRAQGRPVVLMDREPGDLPFDHVLGNDKENFNLLLRHFRELGHRRAALLVNEPSFPEIEERKILFLEAASSLGFDDSLVIECATKPGESSARRAHLGLGEFLQKRKGKLPFSVLLVASAAGGVGVLRALHEHKIAIPAKCCVGSFGYDENNALLVPSITDVGTAPPIWGEWIARLLKQHFSGDKLTIGMSLPVRLTVRESSGSAK